MVSQPSDLARTLKGEWNVGARQFLLPMVCNTEDPKYPTDPAALLDHHAAYFVELIRLYEGRSLADLPGIRIPDHFDTSHLTRSSRKVIGGFNIGMGTWCEGWLSGVSESAMIQAAFAIMQGQSIPNDPISGLPYSWDPVMRQLSQPDFPVVRKTEIKSILVPLTP